MRAFVHVHLYYLAQWPLLESKLSSITIPYDLCVTMTGCDAATQAAVHAFKPEAQVVETANRGFDIGPFIAVLNMVDPAKYDFLIKLHTKRDLSFFTRSESPNMEVFANRHWCSGSRWRDYLLSFLDSRESFEQCLAAFGHDDKLGMIGDFRLIEWPENDDPATHAAACAFLNKLGMAADDFCFVAGTMFMARPELFRPLQAAGLKLEDFEENPRRGVGGFAHVLERVLGGMVCAQGFRIGGSGGRVRRRFFPWAYRSARLFKFVFHSRVTSSGYRSVKILKIPVWHARVHG